MTNFNRRRFIQTAAPAAALAATANSPLLADESGAGVALGNRAHLFARPETKEKLIHCLGTVLGCGSPSSMNAPGLSQPMIAFRFPSGGSLSIEFVEDALDEKQASRGAWLEIQVGDSAAVQKRVLEAGFTQVHHASTNTFYFRLPNGQTMGVVPARNPSGSELKAKQG